MIKLVCFLITISILVTLDSYADTRIEEQVIGPANAGGAYAVSPKQVRIAYAATKGSRLVVSIDGIEGPLFDELFEPHGRSFISQQRTSIGTASSGGLNAPGWTPVIFSENGAHYAYAGRQGSEYIVIYDDREIARGPRETLALNYGSLTLSPGGKYVYWVEMKRNGGGASWRLMMNGRPGPWSGHQTMIPTFSPDDTHYTFTYVSENDNQKSNMIVDGNESGYLGNNPVYTADSKLLLTTASINNQPTLLVNGKPEPSGLGVRKVITAPNGSDYATIVLARMENSQGVNMLYLNGKEVRGTEGALDVSFSPDSNRYALVCENTAARSLFMIVDGKKGPEYQGGISSETTFWTPDSSKLIYTAVSGGRAFVIIDDQEIAITGLTGSRVTMAKNGNRYAFATMDGANRNHAVIVDGESVLPASFAPRDLLFSPDGSRFAYVVRPILSNNIAGMVVDGTLTETLVPAGFSQWGATTTPSIMFVFSDDGKHLAQFAGTGETSTLGLYVDGKLIHPSQGRQIGYPSFTPDNQHLFWLAAVQGDRPGHFYEVYVDGEATVHFAINDFIKTRGSWEVDNKGVLTFLTITDNQVKRYRITPSPDMSVAKMADEADALRAKSLADTNAAKESAAITSAASQKQAEADAKASEAKRIADYNAAKEKALAKRKADYEAAVAKKQAAAEAARAARLLHLTNAKRAKQGLPPLSELP